jgi:CRISPR/Cas system-associated exonuclease Cas4 (RecB family)
MTTAEKIIRLSPSSLGLFRECPRCFWLQINEGIHRPSGPFPSLPGGMDLVIKDYFDFWRVKNELPPEIRGKVSGKLFPDLATLKKWRNWRTGLIYEDKDAGGILSGALDDCVVDENRYAPLDYKTRGYPPKENGHEFYQGQMDAYTLLLNANGYFVKNLAYLVYYFPKKVEENGVVHFNVEVKEMKTDLEKAKKELKNAIAVLKSPLPAKHSECAFCSWGEHNID